MRRVFEIDGVETAIWLAKKARGHVLHIGEEERSRPCTLTPTAEKGGYILEVNNARHPVRIAIDDNSTFIHLDGRSYEIGRTDPGEQIGGSSSGEAQDQLVSPMPGVVVSVAVSVGDNVLEGDTMMVIESMKLETTMVAPRDGVVAEVAFGPGESFGLTAVLVRLETGEVN